MNMPSLNGRQSCATHRLSYSQGAALPQNSSGLSGSSASDTYMPSNGSNPVTDTLNQIGAWARGRGQATSPNSDSLRLPSRRPTLVGPECHSPILFDRNGDGKIDWRDGKNPFQGVTFDPRWMQL